MCIYDAIACDCDCDFPMNSTGLSSAPILHTDARIGEKINGKYTHNTDYTGPVSTDIISRSPFASQPVISATNQSFESTGISADIQQPPPHVVDYWFNQLGLSLDPLSPENHTKATCSSFQFPLFDSIIYVSWFYVVRPFSDLCVCSAGVSDWLPLVRL